jgi:hypothetical protein
MPSKRKWERSKAAILRQGAISGTWLGALASRDGRKAPKATFGLNDDPPLYSAFSSGKRKPGDDVSGSQKVQMEI